MSKFAFSLILIAVEVVELGYILAENYDDGIVFYPVTVVAAIVNLVRKSTFRTLLNNTYEKNDLKSALTRHKGILCPRLWLASALLAEGLRILE